MSDLTDIAQALARLLARAIVTEMRADEAADPASAPAPRPAPPRELQDYPLLLKVEDLSEILRLHEKTILAATVRGDRTKVPSPALIGPYRWRRRDLQKFLESASEHDQRRARISARTTAADRGRVGGLSRSPKKRKASAANGHLGGRPTKATRGD